MRSSLYGNVRRFTFVLFDEDEFDYFSEFLFLSLIPQAMVVSPCHPSGDDNEGFHYHVYVQYDHFVSTESVLRRLDMFSISKVFPVKNPKSLIRYFCHYDSPEKGVQYDPSELTVYGNIDIKQYFN